MRVAIDEARRHERTARVHYLFASIGFEIYADLGDAVAVDPEIGAHRRSVGAVNDVSTANKHRACLPLIRACTRSGRLSDGQISARPLYP